MAENSKVKSAKAWTTADGETFTDLAVQLADSVAARRKRYRMIFRQEREGITDAEAMWSAI